MEALILAQSCVLLSRALAYVGLADYWLLVPEYTETSASAALVPEKAAAEGVKLAAEIIQQVAEIPGVAGVHLLVAGNEQAVPDILDGAGPVAVRASRETASRATRGHDGR